MLSSLQTRTGQRACQRAPILVPIPQIEELELSLTLEFRAPCMGTSMKYCRYYEMLGNSSFEIQTVKSTGASYRAPRLGQTEARFTFPNRTPTLALILMAQGFAGMA